MVRLTDINGRQHLVAESAIASITEAGASAAWHSIASFVRTSNGEVIEVRESLAQIEAQMRAAG